MNKVTDEKINLAKSHQIKITDDLEALLNVLPPHIKQVLEEVNEAEKLLEIIIRTYFSF